MKHFLLWLWERRLAHARGVAKGLEDEHRQERQNAQLDVEYCEIMAARARIAIVKARADRRQFKPIR
jgi:hypothetical protein